jgi:ubiquinone/menaquinone biosynthesis C-methylase UbiE
LQRELRSFYNNSGQVVEELSMEFSLGHFPHDDIERRKWHDPEVLLRSIGLKRGQTIMDIGCGGGFYALPAAKIVGSKGRVYGVDTNEHSIKDLSDQAAAQGLENLELRVGRAEETIFCNSCADIVFFGIVLHDFADPKQVLRNSRVMIKPGGRLANLDWKKEDMAIGPPRQKRFSEEVATRLIETAGFSVQSVSEVGRYHYLIIARPQG